MKKPKDEKKWNPVQSLAVLKDLWVEKTYLEFYCVTLASHLDEVIEATRASVPTGRKSYLLDHRLLCRTSPETWGRSKKHPGQVKAPEERLMEYALWKKYFQSSGSRAGGVWERLLQYQVPLYDNQHKDRWGHIDLFGLGEDGRPVVVELKKASSSETPLRALLEASAYAVHIRENWRDIATELLTCDIPTETYVLIKGLAEPVDVDLVLLAPSEYWNKWHEDTRTGKTVSGATRVAYRRLCEAFEGRGMRVIHAEVGLPREWTRNSLVLPTVDVRPVPGRWDDRTVP